MSKKQNTDLHHLLHETEQKRKRKEKTQLLQSIGIEENFVDGNVQINWKTCRGVECRLCIDACPTNALYWREGAVGFVAELCVFCVACVGVCIVDNCIQVCRKRPSGKMEKFCNAREVQKLLLNINSRKVLERLESRFLYTEA